MAVQTWKNQSIPTGAAALGASQAAIESMTESGAGMLAGLEDIAEVPEDAIMRDAKTALMNLDTDQAREEYLLENPSSFHDPDKLKTFKEEMMATDGAREKEGHKLAVISQSKILDGITDPDQFLDTLNRFQMKNDFDGTDDDEGLLSARMTHRLGQEQFSVSRDTILEAGGDPEDETSLTEDVEKRVFDIIDKKIREKYYGASAEVIKQKRNEALLASPWGPRFARRTKELGDMTTKEIQTEKHAHNITNALGGTGPLAQSHLREAVNDGMEFLAANTTRLTDDQKTWIKKPIMAALQRENIDADAMWEQINGAHDAGKGTQANQKRFGREMVAQFQAKFPTLSKEIIDEHLADLIKRSGLEERIGKGNLVYEFQQKVDRDFLESLADMTGRTVDLLIDMDENSVAGVISKKIGEVINESWSGKEGKPKLNDLDRIKLIKQSDATVKKIKSAFINSVNGQSINTLTRDQEATLDIAIYRFLTNTAGYDPDAGYLPYWMDKPDFVIATLGMKDMSKNSIQSLLEGLKQYIPRPKARTPGAQVPGAVSLETMIGKYMVKHGPGDTLPPTGKTPEHFKNMSKSKVKSLNALTNSPL